MLINTGTSVDLIIDKVLICDLLQILEDFHLTFPFRNIQLFKQDLLRDHGIKLIDTVQADVL